MSKRNKNKITILDLVSYEAAARRLVWIEQGCPQFKTGRTVDKKKERNKKICREKIMSRVSY